MPFSISIRKCNTSETHAPPVLRGVSRDALDARPQTNRTLAEALARLRMELDSASSDELADDLIASHRRLIVRPVEAHQRAGLSQAEVARRMGIIRSNVSTFERYDSNPTFQTIRRYALAVGVRAQSQVLCRGQGLWRGAPEDISVAHSDG